MQDKMNRRRWLKTSAATVALTTLSLNRLGAAESPSESFVPARAITREPKFHWFGYYDKLQFDPTDRYVLSAEVGFEHRTPTAADVIGVGMIDLKDSDKWIALGKSHAWGWQQGCMLQWRPGSKSEVIWNDRQDGEFVSHILNVESGQRRTLPKPVYSLSPDGKWAIGANFARIQNLRPGYGYQGVADPFVDHRAPKDSGIYRMNLDTGEHSLIVSLAEVAAIPHQGEKLTEKWNYFNHLLVDPTSERFIFLHRWRHQFDPQTRTFEGKYVTRMFTAKSDGSDIQLIDPSGRTSHFIWRDAQHICAWTRPAGKPSAFYLITDRTGETELVGKDVMTLNGHNTYVPQTENQWILCDTYPDRTARRQTPYLYHVPSGKRRDLGHFYSPPLYQGEWRCDTHPRSSRDGRLVTIDSPHGGDGRQVWLLDVSEIVG